jgi:hypothetical protein
MIGVRWLMAMDDAAGGEMSGGDDELRGERDAAGVSQFLGVSEDEHDEDEDEDRWLTSLPWKVAMNLDYRRVHPQWSGWGGGWCSPVEMCPPIIRINVMMSVMRMIMRSTVMSTQEHSFPDQSGKSDEWRWERE